jgi:hypothetical protein
VLRPGGDQRQIADARKGAELEKRVLAAGRHAGVAETAEVMPRGRNFH